MSSKNVVCIGEVLWDSLPVGMFLGGAPLNVAINLNNLGVNSTIISAVGTDQLGELAVKKIQQRGLDTSLIQQNRFQTGLVEVEIDENGNGGYNIHNDVAWDHIRVTEECIQAVNQADYLVVGSLIFRGEESGKTARRLLTDYNKKAKVVLDVNFRNPFYTPKLIKELFRLADIVKINQTELKEIEKWFKLETNFEKSLSFLADHFNLDALLLTRGENGSVIWRGNKLTIKNRFKVDVKDTVGSGDAFLSGAIFGMIYDETDESTIAFANAMGAFVTSRDGATPKLDKKTVLSFLG